MSAGIRQYVGPARMRLHTNLTDAHTLASRGPDLSVEEPDKLAARRWVSKAKGAMLKVQKDMSLIEEKNEAWQKVIESLDDDERPQEETLWTLGERKTWPSTYRRILRHTRKRPSSDHGTRGHDN
jgi:hypothetical protein